MANIVDYNVETPNTTNSEVQASRVVVQPEPNNYATSRIKANTQNTTDTLATTQANSTTTQNNDTAQTNNVVAEPVVSQTAITVPSDFYDNTVQGYLNAYNQGVAINDYQAQINALNAIDKYRKANGYNAIYTNDIYTLTNQRTAKIKNQIREYEDAIYQAQLAGDTATEQAINQQLEDYKKMVNYSESVNNSATYLGAVEYKSSYDNIINGIVSQLLTDRFIYDPSDDEALIKAQEQATNKIYESMNTKGILDSTMTAQVISKTVSDLTATYEQMSREEFYNNLERLQTTANLIMNLEQTQYDRWLSNVQMKLEYYQAQKDEESYQWDRVNKLGYVDNEASIVLGVPVGTLSPAKREAIEEAQAKTEEMYNQLYTDTALAQAKAETEYLYDLALLEAQGKANGVGKTSIKTEAGSYNKVDMNSKFNGALSGDELSTQALLIESSVDKKNAIIFARENAKDYDAYVEALNEMKLTVKEANEILREDATEVEMEYKDNEYNNEKITREQWKKWYEDNGLDWVVRTEEYQTLMNALGQSTTAEQIQALLDKYTLQKLEDEIGSRVQAEINRAYGLEEG